MPFAENEAPAPSYVRPAPGNIKSFPVRKSVLASAVFTLALVYIIWPRILEKVLLLNEILSLTGLLLLAYKSFRVRYSPVSVSVVLLIGWCLVHAAVSVFRMDALYYYLRNLVIVYSIFVFFVGYYLHVYLTGFLQKVGKLLRLYILVFLVVPVHSLYERFGMAVLFPVLFKGAKSRWAHLLLVPVNFIYAISYESSTAGVIGMFYIFLFLSPGYKFFKQVALCGFVAFILLFIYLAPHLSVMYRYTMQDDVIKAVREAHPLLDLDPNNTWRLMLWYQILVDKFPGNLFGTGFGTPLLEYYPIEDLRKAATLPYVLGAHNSFVYLYGRLGLVFLVLAAAIYRTVFREYFYYKRHYVATRGHLVFLSFFAITIIAAFNPTLETPIFAGSYWLILGLLAKTIENRRVAAGTA